MRSKSKKRCTSLVLIPLYAAFFLSACLYLFVGEFFSEERQWGSFFSALVPGGIYLLFALVARKNHGIGGILFIFLATAIFFLRFVKNLETLPVYILSGTTFIIGFLFIFFRRRA